MRELATILERREDFENRAQCHLHIFWPPSPDEEKVRQGSLLLKSWHDSATGQRYYQYNRLQRQDNELGETEYPISLQATCDQSGHVIAIKMAKEDDGLSLMHELEDMFPDKQDTIQKYANEWIAHSIEEFGFIKAAQQMRQMQLMGQLPANISFPTPLRKTSRIFVRSDDGNIILRTDASVRISLGKKQRTSASGKRHLIGEEIYEDCTLLAFYPDWDDRLKFRGHVLVQPTKKLLKQYAGKSNIACDEERMEFRETELHPEDRAALYLYCQRKLHGDPLITPARTALTE